MEAGIARGVNQEIFCGADNLLWHVTFRIPINQLYGIRVPEGAGYLAAAFVGVEYRGLLGEPFRDIRRYECGERLS